MSSLLEAGPPPRAPPPPPTAPATSLHHGLVGGAHTDLVVTRYTDRLFLCVTQLGKLGSLVEARRERVEEAGPGGRLVYTVTVLLGQEREEVVLLARILAQRLQLATPLVLSVGVRDLTPMAAKQLAEFVLERVEAA